MRRKKTWFLLVVVLMILGVSVRAEARKHDLIIMGCDGAGLKNILKLLDAGRLPTMKSLMDSGAFHLVPVQNIAKTSSTPGLAMVMTGLSMDQTGVVGDLAITSPEFKNTPFDDFARYNSVSGIYTNLNFYVKPLDFNWTIPGKLKEYHFRSGWFTSKGVKLGGRGPNESPFAYVVQNVDAQYYDSPGKGGDVYQRKVLRHAKAFISNQIANDFKYFVFCDFNADHYGLRDGENSERYLQEIVRFDNALGEVVALVDLEETRIIVMSDHGFNEDSRYHANAPDMWMLTNLPIHMSYWLKPGQRAFASILDIFPTVMDYYGVPLPAIPQIRGKSLNNKGKSFFEGPYFDE